MEGPSEKDVNPTIQPCAGDIGAVVNTAMSRKEMHGWRLFVVMAGLWLSLFLSSLDGTIVSIALIEISGDLNALDQSSWVVVAYFLTYNAFLFIISKLSDTFGTKNLLIASNVIFIVFSAAAASAKTMKQLIVFRVFQGIGGSGLAALVFVVIMKLIEPSKIGFYSGIISSVFAIANLLGPLLGGVITDNTSWRWIFWLNLPITTIATACIVLAMPNLGDIKLTRAKLLEIDVIGGLLSVAWLIPFLFALQEAGVEHPWSSSIIIGTLTGGLIGLLIFAAYETYLHRSSAEPIFPVRVITQPVPGLIILGPITHLSHLYSLAFLVGTTFLPSAILFPQRSQAVASSTPSHAGIQLLALVLLTPPFALIAGLLSPKPHMLELLLILSSLTIVAGTVLGSTLPTSPAISPTQYGAMILFGAGFGTALPLCFALLKVFVPDRDQAAATGALSTAEILGGTIGTALAAAVLHDVLRSDLTMILPPEEVGLVGQSLGNLGLLGAEKEARVREVFGKAYNKQFKILIALRGRM